MQVKKILTIAYLLTFCISTHASKLSPRELLINASSVFNKGDYQKTIFFLEKLDIRKDLDNSENIENAFKILAISYGTLGHIDKAKEVIRELFFLNPRYKFDPFDTPKKILALAKKEKKKIEEKNKIFKLTKEKFHQDKKIKLGKKNKDTMQKKIIIEKKPHITSTIIPFGINHFILSSKIKGSIYLTLQSLSIATNVFSYWRKQSFLRAYKLSHFNSKTYRNKFRTWQGVQFAALSTLVVTLVASIIHAVVDYQNMTDSVTGKYSSNFNDL